MDLPYNVSVMDAVLVFLAGHDEDQTWTIGQVVEGAEAEMRKAVAPMPSLVDVERTVYRMIGCWGFLEWCDPLHVQLSRAGRRGCRALLESQAGSA